jgi:hypothetical protein
MIDFNLVHVIMSVDLALTTLDTFTTPEQTLLFFSEGAIANWLR